MDDWLTVGVYKQNILPHTILPGGQVLHPRHLRRGRSPRVSNRDACRGGCRGASGKDRSISVGSLGRMAARDAGCRPLVALEARDHRGSVDILEHSSWIGMAHNPPNMTTHH